MASTSDEHLARTQIAELLSYLRTAQSAQAPAGMVDIIALGSLLADSEYVRDGRAGSLLGEICASNIFKTAPMPTREVAYAALDVVNVGSPEREDVHLSADEKRQIYEALFQPGRS